MKETIGKHDEVFQFLSRERYASFTSGRRWKMMRRSDP